MCAGVTFLRTNAPETLRCGWTLRRKCCIQKVQPCRYHLPPLLSIKTFLFLWANVNNRIIKEGKGIELENMQGWARGSAQTNQSQERVYLCTAKLHGKGQHALVHLGFMHLKYGAIECAVGGGDWSVCYGLFVLLPSKISFTCTRITISPPS